MNIPFLVELKLDFVEIESVMLLQKSSNEQNIIRSEFSMSV